MVDETPEKAELAGFFLRLVWMLVANAALIVLLAVIALSDSALHSPVSVAFWIVVGLAVLARYVDVTRYKGTTMEDSAPATLRDVKRFSAGLVCFGGAAWMLAHIV